MCIYIYTLKCSVTIYNVTIYNCDKIITVKSFIFIIMIVIMLIIIDITFIVVLQKNILLP